MEISEVEPEKKLSYLKWILFVTCSMTPYLNLCFKIIIIFLILTAPPKAGKSTWIMNCLCKHGKVYNRKFDKVYVVSPSLKTSKENPFETLPPEQIENELTVDFLDRFVNEISESGEKVLLLLDACSLKIISGIANMY